LLQIVAKTQRWERGRLVRDKAPLTVLAACGRDARDPIRYGHSWPICDHRDQLRPTKIMIDI
jgi:hypothetical protein